MKKEEQDTIPEVDESLLTPEQKEEMERERRVPWKFIIFTGVILTLIIACVIVIRILS